MLKCALLSIENTSGWFIDDDLLHKPLKDLGWHAQNVPWNAPVNWDNFDVVIIRSPWDYQNHFNKFMGVLETIHESKAILLNSLDLVKWNIDKNYLFELHNKGVEIIPTLKVTNLNKEQVLEAFKKLETDQLIIKPMMGANADDTFRIGKNDLKNINQIIDVFSAKEGMIQPFMQNIIEEGEYSLMFFEDRLSHVILKTVGAKDYRVQEEHGGGVLPILKPEKNLINAAQKAMQSLPESPFYARVDMVRTSQNSFALMELELIEPCLYFRFDQKAALHFAQDIDSYFKKNI